VQNILLNTLVFLQKRADFERPDLQAADLQRFPIFPDGAVQGLEVFVNNFI
jgi:hypothetical protein